MHNSSNLRVSNVVVDVIDQSWKLAALAIFVYARDLLLRVDFVRMRIQTLFKAILNFYNIVVLAFEPEKIVIKYFFIFMQ